MKFVSDVLRDFFAENAYLFKDSPLQMGEQDLEQYEVFQRYLRLYEATLSEYIESLDVTVEDFFFQLEDVKNDPTLHKNDKKLLHFVNYLLASTDYPAFYKVMIRAAKKQFPGGITMPVTTPSVAEEKGESKGGEAKRDSSEKSGGKESSDYDYGDKSGYK